MIRHLMDKFHRSLAGFAPLVRLVLLVRNQCNCVIKYYLAKDANPGKNGEQLFLKHLVPHIKTFADAGANKGDYTQLVLEQNAPMEAILLFEPSMQGFKLLSEKFGSFKNVVLIHSALSDSPGEQDFFEEPSAGETSSLLGKFSNSLSSVRKVKIATLNQELRERNLEQLDFLKIDTEGYDYLVLKGASDYLRKQKIGVIQFEYNTPWAYSGSTLYKALEYLSDCNYTNFILRKDGLYHFTYERFGEFYTYANFVSVSPHWLNHCKKLIKGTI